MFIQHYQGSQQHNRLGGLRHTPSKQGQTRTREQTQPRVVCTGRLMTRRGRNEEATGKEKDEGEKGGGEGEAHVFDWLPV